MQLHLSNHPRFTSDVGESIALQPRDAALLAFLALEGPTSRARLAALLWPDRKEDTARNALRQRLFQLRRQIGADLVVGAAVLSLADAVTHDLDEGDSVLGDAEHAYSAEFSAWLEHQRQRRCDRLRHSLTELCRMAEQAEDWPDALGYACELLALDDLSEAAYRRVMRLHYLAGDRAAALLAFDRCEHVLKHEVGVAPSPETLELLQTVDRSGHSAVVPADAPPIRAARVVPASVMRPPRRIGREAAWASLREARDTGRVVLLSGEPGMGKSRLLSDLALDEPRSPPRVLIVTARPGDAAVPYALLGRCVRRLIKPFALVPEPAQRPLLARLLPELGEAAPMSPQDDRARLAHAVDALLGTAAGRGLRLVAVDDLQFADDASVELLTPLIASAHCGWVVAMRPGELGAAGQALVHALGAAAPVQALTLQPLDVGEIATLLATLSIAGVGGDEQAQALLRRTGGSPMFLLETLKAALTAPAASRTALTVQRVPAFPAWPSAPNVVRLIQQRLARLSPLALRVARCAAVAGQDLSAALVARVLDQRPLDLTDAWAELEAAQVLYDSGFVHDLIAEAAAAAVPGAIARALHSEIAAYLEQAQGEPARIADHWIAAGLSPLAVPHLSAAANRAREAWRLREAAELHRRAAVILRGAGQRSAAFDAFAAEADALSEISLDQRLIDCGQALHELADDDGQRATAALVGVVLRVETRRLDEARLVALDALPLAQRAGLPDIEAELLWCLAMIHWEWREVADAVRLTERALELLRRVDGATSRLRMAGRELRMTHGLGMFLSAAGQYVQSNAQFAEVHRLAGLSRRPAPDAGRGRGVGRQRARAGRGEALRWSGEAAAGLDRLEVIPGSRASRARTVPPRWRPAASSAPRWRCSMASRSCATKAQCASARSSWCSATCCISNSAGAIWRSRGCARCAHEPTSTRSSARSLRRPGCSSARRPTPRPCSTRPAASVTSGCAAGCCAWPSQGASPRACCR